MSAKCMDKHNRWRSKTVGFRVSPEEDALIEAAVSLSGLTKQDYIVKKLTDKEIVVMGNPMPSAVASPAMNTSFTSSRFAISARSSLLL